MTLTPVFTTWDLSGIWILSGQGGKPQKLKRTFLCLVLHAQWNLCSTLQTEPPLCNTVQVAETVAEGHFGKHFNSRMPDAPLLKLTHLNSYSHNLNSMSCNPLGSASELLSVKSAIRFGQACGLAYRRCAVLLCLFALCFQDPFNRQHVQGVWTADCHQGVYVRTTGLTFPPSGLHSSLEQDKILPTPKY